MKKQTAEKYGYRVPKGRVLVLRTSNADGTSRNGFQWPKEGHVEASDFEPTKECGNGLHGALRGEGDGSMFNWNTDAIWQVVEVDASSIIDLDGKVKFPAGTVVYSGDRLQATDIMQRHYVSAAVIGGTATAGYRGKATAGDMGTATAGDMGTATAGNMGEATAGKMGTATAGYRGTATAGSGGIIQIKYHDGVRRRIATGYVGEDGIEPNTPYRVKNGKLVKP